MNENKILKGETMTNNKIHILDSLPGSGKSTSAINYINQNSDRKFILVCELLTEIERYCENTHLVPTEAKYQQSKSQHANMLLNEDQSIAITHSLLLNLDSETLDLISEKKYEIIIDEVLHPFKKETYYTANDLKILKRRGIVHVDGIDGTVSYLMDEPLDTKYRALKDYADTGQLVAVPSTGQILHRLPVNIFSVASKVTIMTYMFDGSLLDTYLRKRGFEIIQSDLLVQKEQKEYKEEIAVNLNIQSNRIIDKLRKMYRPERPSRYFKSDKMCSNNFYKNIDKECSVNVMTKGSLRDNLGKVILSCAKQSKVNCDSLMYCFFKKYATVPENLTPSGRYPNYCIRPLGFSGANCLVPLSARGTNNFAHKTTAVYCVNLFIDPNFKKYLNYYYEDVFIDEDSIALANLLQWLFRGCIRNGQPMDVYILSHRMEALLKEWKES